MQIVQTWPCYFFRLILTHLILFCDEILTMFPNLNMYDNIGLGLIFQMQGRGDKMRVQIWMENTF
jgi:hypothetical protein